MSASPQANPAPSLKRPSRVARVVAWFARLGRGVRNGVGPGAILDKELRVQGRRVGAYWVRLGFGLLMALVVGLTLANVVASRLDGNGSGTLASIEQLQRSGPIVLLSLAWMLFVGMSFAASIFSAPLICEERRAGTLATLLTTPLSAWQIVVGKACGALVQLLILGLMGLPVLMAVRVFGGISGEVVLASIAIIASATVGNCALGVLASTISPRQSAAIASSIVFTLLWYLAPPLVGLALTRLMITVPWSELAVLSPGSSMVFVSSQISGQPIPLTTGTPIWVLSSLVSLVVAGVAFGIATLRLRALMRQVAAGREGRSQATVAPTQREEASLEAVADLTPRERRRALRRAARRARASQAALARAGSRTVGDQPVLWRELRQPIATRRWLAWVSGIGIALVIGYAFYASGEGQVVAIVTSMIGLAASVLIVSGTAGGALGQEREARSWDTLLTTPLTAGQILTGKVAGAMVRLRYIWSFALATALIASLGWDIRPIVIFHLLATLASASFFAACVGLFFGSITKRSMVAIIASLASILGLWLVFPIMSAMCASMTIGGGDRLMTLVGLTNPFAMLAVALEGATDNGDQQYDLFDVGHLDTAAFTIALMVFCGVYVGLGLVLLLGARVSLAASTLRADAGDASQTKPGNIIAG